MHAMNSYPVQDRSHSLLLRKQVPSPSSSSSPIFLGSRIAAAICPATKHLCQLSHPSHTNIHQLSTRKDEKKHFNKRKGRFYLIFCIKFVKMSHIPLTARENYWSVHSSVVWARHWSCLHPIHTSGLYWIPHLKLGAQSTNSTSSPSPKLARTFWYNWEEGLMLWWERVDSLPFPRNIMIAMSFSAMISQLADALLLSSDLVGNDICYDSL